MSSSSSSSSSSDSSVSSSSSTSSERSNVAKEEASPKKNKNDTKTKQKQQLLLASSDEEGGSSDEEEGAGDGNSKNNSKSILKVNLKYAKEFDQRKRREELLNARQSGELDSDDESSSSEEEDEDGGLLTPGMDLNIIRTIKALRKKDESIYDQNKKFFDDDDAQDDDDDSSSDNSDNEGKKKKNSRRPMKYKDVIREQVLEQMEAEERGEIVGGDGDEDATGTSREQDEDQPTSRFAYDDEQRELRAAFLNSTKDDDSSDDCNDDKDDDEDGDDWMVVKKTGSRADGDKMQKLVENEISELEQIEDDNKATSISDPRGEVGDGDKFLLDFIKNKRWVDKDLHNGRDDDDDGEQEEQRGVYRSKGDGHDSDASLDELEQMDAFESKYNFRFEEAAAAEEQSGAAYSVVGYARGAASNTLRRKDETRKQKRLARKEKKAAERKAKEERLRRLKNAKREELEGRIKQVRQVVGASEGDDGAADIDEAALMKLMEGDYDPEKFEQIMSKAYGDDFYEQEDAEWKTDADVKETLKRDVTGAEGDIINEDTGGMYDEYSDDDDDDAGNGGGQESAEDGNWGEEEEDLDFDPEPPQEKESGIEKKLREKMEDELYKLDYEDIIGDMPTRFKYRKVEANRYGLTPQEILFAKDSTLKQFVSLKRMVPYREGKEFLPGTKKRKRFRDIAKHDYEELAKEEQDTAPVAQEVVSKEGQDDAGKKKKKRRRQKKKKGGNAAEAADKGGVKKDVSGSIDDVASDKKDIAGENAGKRKRKNSKKGGEGEQSANADNIATSEGIDEKASDAVKDAKKKRKKKTKDGKSSSKKRKGSKIAGVSESRLAAYGL